MKRFRQVKYLKHKGDREKYFLSVASGKRVVHIGCTDWPFQIEQIKKGSFLHFKLRDVSSDILGVDVDKSGIDFLKKNDLEGKYIDGDFVDDGEIINQVKIFKPDVILIPDVLEHVKNQGEFLQGVVKLHEITLCRTVISTPNAYSLKNVLPLLFRFDFTHEDHRILHNDRTLTRALDDTTLESNWDLLAAQRNISSRYGKTFQVLASPLDAFSRISPQFCDTLIVDIPDKV